MRAYVRFVALVVRSPYDLLQLLVMNHHHHHNCQGKHRRLAGLDRLPFVACFVWSGSTAAESPSKSLPCNQTAALGLSATVAWRIDKIQRKILLTCRAKRTVGVVSTTSAPPNPEVLHCLPNLYDRLECSPSNPTNNSRFRHARKRVAKRIEDEYDDSDSDADSGSSMYLTVVVDVVVVGLVPYCDSRLPCPAFVVVVAAAAAAVVVGRQCCLPRHYRDRTCYLKKLPSYGQCSIVCHAC